MSVYGYPREPEGTGDEIPPPDVPYRVTSQPVSVPNSPPPPPEPLLPPAPLLPAHPPGAPYAPSYTSSADFIPSQRQAPDVDTVRVGAPDQRSDEGDAGSGQRAETKDESDSGFQWLRPSRSNPASASATPPPPPPPAPAPPPPPVPPPTMGQPSAGASSPFGSSPAMGQPGLADRPGSGAFPVMGQPPASDIPAPMGQPPVADAGPALGSPPLADGPAFPGVTGEPADGSAEPGRPEVPPLPRRTSAYAMRSAGSASPTSVGSTSVGPAPLGSASFGSASAPVEAASGAVPTQAPAAEPVPAPEALPTSVPGPEPSSPAASPWGPPSPADAPGAGAESPGSPGIQSPEPGPAGPGQPSPTPPASVPPGSVPPASVPSGPVSPAAGDGPEIQPWDRRPLLVVIASAVVLVLIGILSGVVTATLASTPLATWHEQQQSEPDSGSGPSADPSPAGPGAGETITLSGVGDVILGSVNLGVPPNGGAGFFDGVRDALAADVVMGNLDQALSDPTGYQKCPADATDCFQLSLPPSYANVLRDGGFTLMNLANNHTYDMGQAGYANTRSALDAVGIAATGGVGEITYLTVKGVRVAVLGFSVYSYTANLNDITAAANLVRQAAAEADLVVVQMQGGAEGSDRTHVPPAGQHEIFWGEDRGDLRGFAHAVVDAGADIVFGHGPHVMRGMEFYQGRLIAYSLGNFCGYSVLSSSGWSGVGGILKVTLTRDGSWVSGQLIATEMVNGGFPALDEERRALAFVDDLSVADFGATAARIDHTTGVITAP